jgi:hypothetical protein
MDFQAITAHSREDFQIDPVERIGADQFCWKNR